MSFLLTEYTDIYIEFSFVKQKYKGMQCKSVSVTWTLKLPFEYTAEHVDTDGIMQSSYIYREFSSNNCLLEVHEWSWNFVILISLGRRKWMHAELLNYY